MCRLGEDLYGGAHCCATERWKRHCGGGLGLWIWGAVGLINFSQRKILLSVREGDFQSAGILRYIMQEELRLQAVVASPSLAWTQRFLRSFNMSYKWNTRAKKVKLSAQVIMDAEESLRLNMAWISHTLYTRFINVDETCVHWPPGCQRGGGPTKGRTRYTWETRSVT